jgi:hypothetical protein
VVVVFTPTYQPAHQVLVEEEQIFAELRMHLQIDWLLQAAVAVAAM